MNQKIRIMIVEDEERIRENMLKHVLELGELCTVVGCCQNGVEALEQIEEVRPQVVFTDIKMPYMDGMELAKTIKDLYPSIYTIIITGFSDFQYAQQAIRCGVYDYLLKPIAYERVEEIIRELVDKIQIASYNIQRNTITSKNYKLAKPEELHGLFLIQFGNNFHGIYNETVIRYLKKINQSLKWERIFRGINEGNREWLLADENVLNMKCLVVKQKDNEVFDCEKFGNDLREILQELCPEIAINICFMKELSAQKDIWKNLKIMRKYMNRFIIVGKSVTFSYDDTRNGNHSQKILEVVKSRINEQLEQKIKRKNKKEIIEEVLSILNFAAGSSIYQKTYEKIIEHISHVFEFSVEQIDEEIMEELFGVYQTQLYMANSYEEINGYFINCVEGYLGTDSIEEDTVIEQVVEYVDMNITKIESVKSVADKFNYNYNYFSRLFKNYAGVSLSKYLTSKRIELAKKLMEENKELNVNIICFSVGYDDSHYFSRVFKKETGYAPSEYRNKVIEK